MVNHDVSTTFLARQLLSDDGIIFISIDDREVYNLRLIMNEIFGEGNCLQQMVYNKWRQKEFGFLKLKDEDRIDFKKKKTEWIMVGGKENLYERIRESSSEFVNKGGKEIQR